MGELVSVREMARRRGCTHGAVQKAISTGRIPASAVKRDDARRIEGIYFEAATAAWNENTDVDQAARTPGGAATVAGSTPAGELALGGESKTAAPAQATNETSAIRVASAAGKQLQNQLLELELMKETGALVSRDEVKELAARRYRAIRDQILAVPDRVADILAAERDSSRVHAELTKELERVLNELADDAAAESSALAQGETAERMAA